MPDEFYSYTWVDFSRAAQGYWLRHSRYMEGVRRLSYFTVLMNTDPKKVKSIKEDRLFSLLTDEVKSTKIKPVSKEEYDAIIKRYSKNGR